MIQLIYEFDGRVPFGFRDYRVTGSQVLHEGRFFQVLEGPEHAVMAAFETLSGEASQLARIEIARRDFARWSAEALPIEALPDVMADRLLAFAALVGRDGASASAGDAASITPDRAITFLSRLAPSVPAVGSSYGGRVISRIEGRSGNRSWIAL